MARLGKYYSSDGRLLGELMRDVSIGDALHPRDVKRPDGTTPKTGDGLTDSDKEFFAAFEAENGFTLGETVSILSMGDI